MIVSAAFWLKELGYTESLYRDMDQAFVTDDHGIIVFSVGQTSFESVQEYIEQRDIMSGKKRVIWS